MNRALREAINEWDNEVGREAARLIREGMSPFQANAEALDIVQHRRRAKAIAEQTTQHPLNQFKDTAP